MTILRLNGSLPGCLFVWRAAHGALSVDVMGHLQRRPKWQDLVRMCEANDPAGWGKHLCWYRLTFRGPSRYRHYTLNRYSHLLVHVRRSNQSWPEAWCGFVCDEGEQPLEGVGNKLILPTENS
jgi:hypothetical protein